MQTTSSAELAPSGAAGAGQSGADRFTLGAQPRTLIGFFAVTLALRAIMLGNPVAHVDEQFYQLVADRWAAGALPYVDIWDRKPIGLFALYRLIGMLPGDHLLDLHLCSAAATVCTALVVQRLAAELAPPAAARLAALVYIMAMPAFSCAFGQAPVFYNLLIALAALATVRAWTSRDSGSLLARAAIAMALVGIALQIKYSVVFEGAGFGLAFVALAWNRGWRWPMIAGAAALWCAIALAPTALAWGAYAAIGHSDAFVQANFVSIFRRMPDGQASWLRLVTHVVALSPFWLALFVAPRHVDLPQPADATARTVLRLWAFSAVAGYLVFGTWYDHYVAPLLAPLAVLSAPVLAPDRTAARWYARFIQIAAPVGALAVMGVQRWHHGSAREFAELTRLIRGEVHGGCFFMVDGEPRLYDSVGACIPTRFAFSSHLTTWTEAPALGTDPNREVARIMLSHPDVVLIGEWTAIYLPNHVSRAVAQDFLARDYERYAGYVLGTHRFGLYRLRRR